MPEPLHPYYEVVFGANESEELKLTSKVPLTLSVLDPERVYSDECTETGETEELPAGTVFHFWRTDNATFVDMITDDGRPFRIWVEGAPTWEQYVNGYRIEDCFDGVRFAA